MIKALSGGGKSFEGSQVRRRAAGVGKKLISSEFGSPRLLIRSRFRLVERARAAATNDPGAYALTEKRGATCNSKIRSVGTGGYYRDTRAMKLSLGQTIPYERSRNSTFHRREMIGDTRLLRRYLLYFEASISRLPLLASSSPCPVPMVSDNATRTSFQPIPANSSTQENERDRPSMARGKRNADNKITIVFRRGRPFHDRS